ATEKHTKAPEGAATGATTGGVIGGVLGWLVGLGTLAIPGVGPLIAGGPIVAALTGVGVGGAIGGIAGALIGMGIPEYEAKRYEGRIKEGGILLSVHCDNSKWTKKAHWSALEQLTPLRQRKRTRIGKERTSRCHGRARTELVYLNSTVMNCTSWVLRFLRVCAMCSEYHAASPALRCSSRLWALETESSRAVCARETRTWHGRGGARAANRQDRAERERV